MRLPADVIFRAIYGFLDPVTQGWLGATCWAARRRHQADTRFECGLTLENYNDVKEGDVLEVYAVREVARTA